MPTSYSHDRLFVGLLFLLVPVCLASDFLMVPMLTTVTGPSRIGGMVGVLAIVGCVLAQGCSLAAWLAWSEEPLWLRLAWHWIVAVILFSAWAAGLGMGRVSQAGEITLFVGLTVPLVSIGAQVPLWITRQSFGWRLVRGDRAQDSSPAPLSIRDLMTATVLVAISLALARLAPSPDGKPLGKVWIVMFALAALGSTIALLPASPLLLRTRAFRRGILFAALYAAAWVSLLWLVVLISRHWGLFQLPHMGIVVGLSCLILSFATTVILAAAVIRARGYRLVWGRERRGSRKMSS